MINKKDGEKSQINFTTCKRLENVMEMLFSCCIIFLSLFHNFLSTKSNYILIYVYNQQKKSKQKQSSLKKILRKYLEHLKRNILLFFPFLFISLILARDSLAI